ncbi:MAG: winged helix-turn-helix transcriptional regulator [Phormidesmis sp.]
MGRVWNARGQKYKHLHCEVYKQVPPKMEYSLTAYGRSLEPVIFSLRTWGEIHMKKIECADLTTSR